MRGFLALLLSINVVLLEAREIEGVEIVEQIEILDTQLELNGVGVRSKFFFNIYIGALYLTKNAQQLTDIKEGEAWRVSMHFLYDEVTGKDLVDAWNDGFESNNTQAELSRYADQIKQFNGLFKTVRNGEVITVNYDPATGTSVAFNGKIAGIVEGSSFAQVLLKIWLGSSPADERLKAAMLGS